MILYKITFNYSKKKRVKLQCYVTVSQIVENTLSDGVEVIT